jgi:predicted RNase H-like HicB family nuclease
MPIKLTAIYQPQPSGWIVACIAEIPGVITQGRTMDEAREMLADALAQMLECNKDLRLAEAGPGAIIERFEVPVMGVP